MITSNRAAKHRPAVSNNDAPLASALIDCPCHSTETAFIERSGYRIKRLIEP